MVGTRRATSLRQGADEADRETFVAVVAFVHDAVRVEVQEPRIVLFDGRHRPVVAVAAYEVNFRVVAVTSGWKEHCACGFHLCPIVSGIIVLILVYKIKIYSRVKICYSVRSCPIVRQEYHSFNTVYSGYAVFT